MTSLREAAMDEAPILGNDQEDRLVRYFQARFDAPAYVRRARAVEEAYESLLERCRKERDKMLSGVRTALRELRGLAGEWEALRRVVNDEQVEMLRRLEEQVRPAPLVGWVTRSTSRLRWALAV